MSWLVFVLILASAISHALWNALIKAGITHKEQASSAAQQLRGMLMLTAVQALLSLGLIATFGLPPFHVWPFLVISAFMHSGYKFMLARAYRFGDISRVYPLARGAAPVLVLIISMMFQLEQLNAHDALSVLIISIGILLLAQDALVRAENWRLLPFALLSALFTALYTLIDGMGARLTEQAISYVAMVFVLDILLFAPLVYLIYGRQAFVFSKNDAIKGSGAAFFSLFSYLVVVWAMTFAPMAQVSAVRETSVLIAMLLGALFFKDKINQNKLFAGLIIVFGLIFMRFAA